MRPHGLVLLAIGLDDELRLIERVEPVLVEAAVSKLSVKALDERVLSGLSRLDEKESDVVQACPVRKRATRELWTIVDHNDPGFRPARLS